MVKNLKDLVRGSPFFRAIFFFVTDLKFLAKRTLQSIMRLDIFIAVITWIRFFFYAKILRKVSTYDHISDGVAKETIQHNFKGLKLHSLRAFSGARPALLFSIVSKIESIQPEKEKVLIIGPRAESEFFIARTNGFRKHNLVGLDLISYSPYVKIGNMHDMPFDDHTFDIIVVGWVLAYSNNLKRACSEIRRVARTNAIIATGTQYLPESVEEVKRRLGYVPGAEKRIKSNEELLSYFGSSVDHVFYDHDVTKSHPDLKSDLVLVFRLN